MAGDESVVFLVWGTQDGEWVTFLLRQPSPEVVAFVEAVLCAPSR